MHVALLWHPVQALQQWHGLQQQWCSAAPLSTSRQLESAEEAAWLLQRLATQQAVQQLLLEEDIEQLQVLEACPNLQVMHSKHRCR